MGWWPFSSDNGPKAQKAIDGGTIAPTRTDRQACYDSRDSFFKCLDTNNILDSEGNKAEALKACPAELKVFEQNCGAAWVKYFKQKRVVDFKKEEALRKYQAEAAQMTSGK